MTHLKITNTEYFTLMKHKGEPSQFNVFIKTKEASEFWYEKDYVIPKIWIQENIIDDT
jgi:hypothetical protein